MRAFISAATNTKHKSHYAHVRHIPHEQLLAGSYTATNRMSIVAPVSDAVTSQYSHAHMLKFNSYQMNEKKNKSFAI